MQIKKIESGGVWVKASEEKPPMNDTRIGMRDGYGQFIGICYKHNTAIWNTELEDWIYEPDFKKYEWLKPIKDVYVLTEDELQNIILRFAAKVTDYTRQDMTEESVKQFLESIKQ